MSDVRTFNLYKWLIYIGATVLIAINTVTLYLDFVENNIDGVLLSLVFIMLGLIMIIRQRQQARTYDQRSKVMQIAEQYDDEKREAIEFVMVNTNAMPGPQEKWIQVASELYGIEADELVRAFEEIQTDMEILARTGDLPDEYED